MTILSKEFDALFRGAMSLLVFVWLFFFLGATFATTKLLDFLCCDFGGLFLIAAAVCLRSLSFLESVLIYFICWLDHDVAPNNVLAGTNG